MLYNKILIFSAILITFFWISVFQTNKSLTMISNEKNAQVHLETAITKQKVIKEKKLSFLKDFTDKDITLTLQGKKFFFNDKLSYLIYGWENELELDWKKYLILKESIWNIDNWNKLPYANSPVHFLVTKKYNEVSNSCKKGTFFDIGTLNSLKNKLKEKKIDINLMTKEGWSPITKDQIKVEAWLSAEESKLLDIFLSDKKCFFSNEGYDIKSYVFIPVDFMINKLDRKKVSYLVSEKVIDVRRDSTTWDLLGYLYPRDEIENIFTYKDDWTMDKCIFNYSTYNLCEIE